MHFFFIFLGSSSVLLDISGAYDLLKVRKMDSDRSDVDTHIHKAAPSTKLDDIPNKSARKQFADIDKEYNRDEALESVMFGINTDGKENTKVAEKDLVNKVERVFWDLVKKRSFPVLRSKAEKYDIKPNVVNFRGHGRKGKPSVMFEINSKTILNAVKDVLSSKIMRSYVDKLAKKAAVVYRSVKKEFV